MTESQKHSARVMAVVAITITIISSAFLQRFVISFPAQNDQASCLRGNWFVVDTWDRHPQLGALYAFAMPVDTRWYPAGTRFIKQMVGLPGANIDVGMQQTVTPMGVRSMPLHAVTRALGEDPARFVGQRTVKPGYWFAMGDLPGSYDSRFWGQVPNSKIIGRAYAIF